MAKIGCFCALLGGKGKKFKDVKKVPHAKRANGSDWQKVKPVESMDGTVAASVDNSAPAPACRDTKVVAVTAAELPCQGRDDDKASPARDVGLVGGAATDSSGYNSDKDAAGTGTPDVVSELPLPATPARLERSCSNIETARPGWKAFDLLLPPAKSRSHGDLATLPAGAGSLFASPNGGPGGSSPAPSVRSTCSADRVMLKRRSSSQVLPSRSRKLWWRLFMWSHRNLHRPGAATSSTLPPADTHHQMFHSHRQQHDGYTSDTFGTAADGNCKNKEIAAVEEEPTCPNQWVAFSAEVSSSLDRVSAWVSSLGDSSLLIHAEEQEEEDDEEEEWNGITETEIGEPSGTTTKGHAQAQTRQKRRSRAAEEAVQQASSIVQTLNAFSSVAHISGMGLKAVPMISAFSSLRAVNLSGNFIAHISAGSLPKGLHSLDLSRNSIASIEGLRELTRLRVLSLSYNRIARIGHGLSSCTALRELYLAGNKISDVEGLHRLLKLAVLDLSFNRVTTARGLGQLVANYNSLRALNLLGNPVQANVGDDALRKAVSGLLPLLAYLNKQALRPQRAREAAKDSVAKAALGNNLWSSRRRAGSTARRLGHSPGSSSARREGSGGRSRSLSGVQARR
ncbi:hypothetical protein CFC21_054869 [Triticum aestivum]|uniref:Uncharacterized protein n=3 Tax=Triticum TaxID=4564 RepID=A0A9R0W5W4_TRITD|nr:uncharacterized protein LOC119287688 [Triticum dicoccoides]XP_044366194.1 uncharacterized protein LOC123088100 [Triticum aestivum]KAF7045793.1 hypothetical protein CFC21_054869 [Triticum aestivum]VAH97967.1 unnamed protein product [Triticum turgidum subsp. durum]